MYRSSTLKELERLGVAFVSLTGLLDRSRGLRQGNVQIGITDSVDGQILTDLTALNGLQKLSDGSAPLRTWIENLINESEYDPALARSFYTVLSAGRTSSLGLTPRTRRLSRIF